MTASATVPTLLPPREGIEYLSHQVSGIRWMLEREAKDATVCRGGVLGDDMGLGKTFQTIGLMKNSPLRTLIICPPALVAGWTEELRACGYAVNSLQSGSSNWTCTAEDSGKTPVWVTTYPKAQMYRKQIATASLPGGDVALFERVVLDEGHIIRNGKATSRWMACMAIGKRASCRWILSATPVQNGFNDWQNLCWWLRVKCPSADIPELAETIMLRRTMAELRDDIAALPPPPKFVAHDLTIPVTGPTAAEGKLFRALCDQLNTVMDSRQVSALIKLELYLRIQQFLVHPQLYIQSMRDKFKGAYPRPDWKGTATKWDTFSRLITNGVDGSIPTIVFCNFKQEMDMVVKFASDAGASVWAVRGGMGSEKVGAAVTESREAAAAGKPVVIVVQIVAGGAGLNLQFCKRILFLSQHWNPAVVHQAVGRACRIGQKDVVEVHVFRVIDGVMDNLDRRMIDKHLSKIAAAREICDTLYEGYEPLEEERAGFEEVPGQEITVANI